MYVCMYASVIDQAWGQDGWILAKLSVYGSRGEVHNHTHQERAGPIFSRTLLRKNFSCEAQSVVPNRYDCATLPACRSNQSQRKIWFITIRIK